jgi:2-polyprenyl-6-methoxyphenol hydroxylase-like FAD-dependent oxidoreductase
MEVFEQLGILAGMLRTGLQVRQIGYFRAGEAAPLARFSLGLLAGETRFPFRLHLDKGSVAAALAARLTAYPHVRLAFDAELVGVEQDGAGVAVHVQSALGERVERGAYLLAADGMDSAVRACLGIGLDGVAVAGRLLQVMTPADLGELLPVADAAAWIQAPGGWCGLLRMPDLWQIAVPLQDDASDEAALHDAALSARLSGFLPFNPAGLPMINRLIQPVRRQVAGTYAAGRVLLAGDAAHQAQTRGGLNMNCGLHDAMAAAEALAVALHRPDAAGAALDHYARERRLVATAQLLPYADRAAPGDAAWAAELAETASDPARARAWLRAACMLDMPGFRAPPAASGMPA